jgi:transposase
MASKRRQFSREYKAEAVKLIKSSTKPVSQVARELGVRVDTLRHWVQQVEGRAGLSDQDVFPGNGKRTSQDEELRQLRRELEQVRQERDFLKKAAAYFAKESR